MKTSIDERISALVDSESGEFETRRLTAELLRSEKHKTRWEHYHLIGDILRNEVPTRIEPNFSTGVLAKINEDLPGYDSSQLRSRQPQWLKVAAGLAIAASVATVSILLLHSLTPSQSVQPKLKMATSTVPATAPEPLADGQSPPPMATPVAAVSPATADTNGAKTSVAQSIKTLEAKIVDSRMNSYLATHAEYTTQPKLLPQVRVVGFEHNNK